LPTADSTAAAGTGQKRPNDAQSEPARATRMTIGCKDTARRMTRLEDVALQLLHGHDGSGVPGAPDHPAFGERQEHGYDPGDRAADHRKEAPGNTIRVRGITSGTPRMSNANPIPRASINAMVAVPRT
jgi:hypothetical protein